MNRVSEGCLGRNFQQEDRIGFRKADVALNDALTEWVTFRKRIGMVGAGILLLISVVLIDHLISRFLVTGSELHVIRGESMLLTGPMPEKAERLDQLTTEGIDQGIDVVFTESFRGYWLGMPMWRASIMVSETTAPGTYRFRIADVLGSKPHPGLDITVHVYENADMKRKGHGAYLERWTGISLGRVLMFLMPVLIVLLGINYFASNQVEKCLAATGKAEIYMVKVETDQTLIGFSLGKRNGLMPGARLMVSDSGERDVGEATVLSLTETDGVAKLDFPLEKRAVHMVRMIRG